MFPMFCSRLCRYAGYVIQLYNALNAICGCTKGYRHIIIMYMLQQLQLQFIILTPPMAVNLIIVSLTQQYLILPSPYKIEYSLPSQSDIDTLAIRYCHLLGSIATLQNANIHSNHLAMSNKQLLFACCVHTETQAAIELPVNHNGFQCIIPLWFGTPNSEPRLGHVNPEETATVWFD